MVVLALPPRPPLPPAARGGTELSPSPAGRRGVGVRVDPADVNCRQPRLSPHEVAALAAVTDSRKLAERK